MGVPMPPSSALQSFISTHKHTPHSKHAPHLHHLALQIAHNLHYQHNWSDVRIHSVSSDSRPLPRSMLSGFPPQRLYVHPDEQIELLQKQKSEGKSGMPDLACEREWVLPSHLREKWSLRRFGEVFDAVPTTPGRWEGDLLFEGQQIAKDGVEEGREQGMIDSPTNSWRTAMPKRLLLATLDDDSTVVYYIVHDGIVKPRQN